MLPLLPVIAITGSVYVGVRAYQNFNKKRGDTAPDIAADTTVPEPLLKAIELPAKGHFTIATGALGCALAAPAMPILWFGAVSGLIITTYPVARSAIVQLRRRRSVTAEHLDLVIICGCVAFGYLVAANVLMVAVTTTRVLLLSSQDRSRRGLKFLFGERPRTVMRVVDGETTVIPYEALHAGDVILVHAGNHIPVDGHIATGSALIDQQMLTGESRPVECGEGERVLASTLLLAGRIEVQVEATGSDTARERIGQVLLDTVDRKSSIHTQGERFADTISPYAITWSAAAWAVFGSQTAVTLLNSVPGYLFRIVAPVGTLAFIRHSAMRGVLIKDGRTLEVLPEVDTVVFDKTGTLTDTQPAVVDIQLENGGTEAFLLASAAAIERHMDHPVARAILSAAERRDVPVMTADDVDLSVGFGVSGSVEGARVLVGSLRFITRQGLNPSPRLRAWLDTIHDEGSSGICVARDDRVLGAFHLEHPPRPEVSAVLAALRKRGLRTVLMTGDHQAPAERLGKALGFDEIHAEVVPERKAEIVAELQENGSRICFVGDGINDSIALRRADVSISMHGAADIAVDNAQIVLNHMDLRLIPLLFEDLDRYQSTMTTAKHLTIIPPALSMAGALFLGTGILGSIAMNQVAIWGSVAVILPRLGKPHFHTSQPELLARQGEPKAQVVACESIK